MRMKKIYLLLFLLVGILDIQAQEERSTKNEIGLSLGYNSGYFKDLNYSVLNYSDRGLYTRLHYNRQFTKAKLKTTLGFQIDELSTDVAPFFATSFPRGTLMAEYLFDAFKNEKWDISVGPMLSSDNQMLLFNGFLSFSFLFVHSAGVSSDFQYRLDDKNSFQFSIQLPLVHLLVRPPYNGYDKETEANENRPLRLITNGKFATVNEYVSVNSSFAYKKVLNKRFDLIGSYEIHFQRTFQTAFLIQLQNRYKVSFNYKF